MAGDLVAGQGKDDESPGNVGGDAKGKAGGAARGGPDRQKRGFRPRQFAKLPRFPLANPKYGPLS